ncbi:ABC transporter ATP-binding protein [Butyrivibrio sp. AE3006]|uniref:ABC transporter ATP-binding protein n=1 Tax=Butyrivibrio sp. AE3006 TaxID=1280673 RepID=UPI00040AE9D8|nr:ABC transporter ATP-binding protein [Butyrivibrio sp. AE3006]
MSETVIKIENIKKQYHLGTIGGGTLTADLQSWWARKRGKEDPNTQIGTDSSKFGDSFYALDGINLEVHKGEALGIIGANGAGKSTLLKLLCRVTAPTEGSIKMKGRIASMLEVGTGFHPELTGRENIYMNGAILGMTKSEIDSKIEEIIDFSECRQFIDTPVKRFSSGMYVKLAFAVAAHLDAEIMIMDEVLAVGDMKFQEKCLGKMGDAANSDGKTILYVSHNMATIRNLCSRCIVLEKGKIVFNGDVDEAIAYYMGTVDISETKYDFTSIKRTAQENCQVVMQSFEFEDEGSPVYTFGSKLNCAIKLKSYIDVTGVSIRMTLFYMDNTPVTTIYTDGLIDISKDEEKTVHLSADISTIAPGKYYADLIVWKFNDQAAHIRYDSVKGKVHFVIKTRKGFNHGFEWGHGSYGHVVLPKLEIQQ